MWSAHSFRSDHPEAPGLLSSAKNNLAAILSIAEWGHNIAYFSINDFEGFNEEKSRKEGECLLRPHCKELSGTFKSALSELGIDLNLAPC